MRFWRGSWRGSWWHGVGGAIEVGRGTYELEGMWGDDAGSRITPLSSPCYYSGAPPELDPPLTSATSRQQLDSTGAGLGGPRRPPGASSRHATRVTAAMAVCGMAMDASARAWFGVLTRPSRDETTQNGMEARASTNNTKLHDSRYKVPRRSSMNRTRWKETNRQRVWPAVVSLHSPEPLMLCQGSRCARLAIHSGKPCSSFHVIMLRPLFSVHVRDDVRSMHRQHSLAVWPFRTTLPVIPASVAIDSLLHRRDALEPFKDLFVAHARPFRPRGALGRAGFNPGDVRNASPEPNRGKSSYPLWTLGLTSMDAWESLSMMEVGDMVEVR